MSKQLLSVREVRIDPNLGLLVLTDNPDKMNELVYRDASGIRWDVEVGAFRAFEPHKWENSTLIEGIRIAVSNELGLLLDFNLNTVWGEGTEELRK